MSTCDGEKKLSPLCRPRKALDYVSTEKPGQEMWRCPACHAHYEDPVTMSCGDVLCRACVATVGGICPACRATITEQVVPARMQQRLADGLQCNCPNRGLGCPVQLMVQAVELHLRSGCEWREEECDQCHQQVRHPDMARHKDTTCAAKQMACGYADVGCPTRCAQGDLAAHKRDGVVAHMGLLRQRLADTSADLTQCKADLTQTQHDLTQTQHDLTQCKADLTQTQGVLTQTQHDLAQTKADLAEGRASQSAVLTQTQHDLAQTKAKLTRCQDELAQTKAELAQTKEQTQGELAAIRSQIDQLFIPPAAPESLVAHWDAVTKEVALEWRPVREGVLPEWRQRPRRKQQAPLPCAPVRYRVQATLVAGCEPSSSPIVVYTGPECRCRYRFPAGAVPGKAEAHFAVVAMRGLAESGPSAPTTCTRPAVAFRYEHDMDDRGLFYYIGTQGRTQPWQNPAEAGWVTATRSSEQAGKASDLTGRQPCTSYTSNQPNSWWQVDLGAGRLFTPTRYTLRHSNRPANVVWRLQSWRLEGSVDGAEGSWRTLDEHANEPNALPILADAMVTFAVAPERAFPARHFRVLMTGPSPNGGHHLMLSGLEMYGTLVEQ
ncbi:putative E3 ubiquitin-protein ligase HECTD1 [Paratrimastix pyriformis]|uniref:E3 ubiquitin-protein ligase HECTD1 n=1 Tax=Paratrimastix pyriformis TaxID=342808 RepID=A0ABQ8UJN1_9EUKA|nr:putative E3 ubiquitin-protein ligase HECTD1 [Paratrimastix pyriformis]